MESKIEATERLRREGRWDKASQFRDEQRIRLKEQGFSSTDAKEKAWELMLEAFPPKPLATPESPLSPDVAVQAESQGTGDWVRDVFWVYENIENKNPGVAPGHGAVAMLTWARQNPARFFDSLLPKAMVMIEKRTEEKKRFHDDGRKIFAKLEAFERSLMENRDDHVQAGLAVVTAGKQEK